MTRSDSPGGEAVKKGKFPASTWAKLTWEDLELWAGSRSVARGRAYQRGGRVQGLMTTADGGLLATVVGTYRYATTVALKPGGKGRSLESSCTCPVGVNCKHAVATVADYLQALADGRDLPVADEDDPRWDKLDGESVEDEGDRDDGDYDDDDSWDDEEPDERPVRKPRRPGRASSPGARATNWDDKIERHLRAKSQGELADLVWSLTRRFPEVYQEFRERLALQEGDVERLLAEARREIRKVTAEPAWSNHWNGDGHTPDYSRVRHRLERLLELGHADAVVSLGREFIRAGMGQIEESHDEGETATAFGECLPVVFQAVAVSSLTGPERLLFAIDAEMDDGYDALGDATAVVLDGPSTPEDWSVVADTLADRLKAAPDGGEDEEDGFSSSYRRDCCSSWVATALGHAGREGELRALYETEARATNSYERLVNYLLEARQFEDAERWAKEGIAATGEKLPGIAGHLAASLCELARKRKQWDVVAAHVALPFFDHPNASRFEDLVKAARKAGVEPAVRGWALRFLETGVAPFQVIGPPPQAAPPRRAKGRSAKGRPASPSPVPTAPAPARVAVDRSWPLPMPDELIPLLRRPGPFDTGPRPHLEVLLQMAIDAKQPDEVLRWFDAMRSATQRPGSYPYDRSYADRVAEAVAATHPERTLRIYTDALNSQLPHAQQSAYDNATAYLKKLRPVYASLGRAGEWDALLASVREKYRNRPLFMERLDRLDGRPIVDSTRTRRK